ncbi:hypothetical protein GQ600_16569 [Phytophthora cactorum]|nr:hypothetical protein GQ600_16569 [Phytophthora cactorum]
MFTPSQVAGFFFQPCCNEFDEIIFDKARRNGFSNLMYHVRSEHPDYESLMLAARTAETGSIINYVRRSSLNLFSWLEWILKNNLPLSFCENEVARR